ncbi:MAG: alpha/beta hydrolase [Candidatus Acidiferrales bacterium]
MHFGILPSLFLGCALGTSALAQAAHQELDIPYVPGGGHRQQLDLYLPKKPGFATILFVHGGSLEAGDRTEFHLPEICQNFVKAGLGCATTSYRLLEDQSWPAQPTDVAAAFAWLKKNIRVRGGDPGKIFLAGHSSGARLVALVSSDESYLQAHGLSARDIAGTVVMGTILHIEHWMKEAGGQESFEKNFARTDEGKTYASFAVFRNSWPYYHVGPHLPPMLILVAEAEKINPPCWAHALEFQEAAHRVGARVEVKELPGRKHMTALEKMAEPGDPTFLEILRFLGQELPKN